MYLSIKSKCYYLISAYINGAAALCVIALLADLVATLLAGLGLRSNEHRIKYKYYRAAVYTMVLALVAILVALVIYPVFFAKELAAGKRIKVQIKYNTDQIKTSIFRTVKIFLYLDFFHQLSLNCSKFIEQG